MLIDSHCHLDFPEFAAELPAVISRAKAAGVERMITISTRVAKYDVYRAIAEAHEEVWFSVGTHPHQAHEEPDVSVEQLVGLSSHPRCVAIGEAGLDYHYDKSPRDVAEIRSLPRFARLHADIWAVLKEEVLRGYAQQQLAG